jgi:hypothetical protein
MLYFLVQNVCLQFTSIYMLFDTTKTLSILALLTTVSCSIAPTEPFTNFVGDPIETVYIDNQKISKPIKVKVVMPNGDIHSEECRLSGSITLPENMTYSSYLEKILTESLYLSDRLASTKDPHAPFLKILIESIDFQSYAGKWEIRSAIYINNKEITNISSSIKFPIDFDNNLACSDAINSFDKLCRKFIFKVLYNSQVMQSIKSS